MQQRCEQAAAVHEQYNTIRSKGTESAMNDTTWYLVPTTLYNTRDLDKIP